MRVLRRWAVLPAFACFALFLNGSTLAGTAVRSSATGAQTFTVNVDGFNKKTNESFLAYFPRAVTVHAGDTVRFHYVGVGEPHTVTLGTLANAAVEDCIALLAQAAGGECPA